MSMWDSININRTNLPDIDVSKIDKAILNKISEDFMNEFDGISLDEGGSVEGRVTSAILPGRDV